MPVIPINDDYSNISNFIDSLFDKDVRSLDNIKSAIFQGKTLVTFSDEGEKNFAGLDGGLAIRQQFTLQSG